LKRDLFQIIFKESVEMTTYPLQLKTAHYIDMCICIDMTTSVKHSGEFQRVRFSVLAK